MNEVSCFLPLKVVIGETKSAAAAAATEEHKDCEKETTLLVAGARIAGCEEFPEEVNRVGEEEE